MVFADVTCGSQPVPATGRLPWTVSIMKESWPKKSLRSMIFRVIELSPLPRFFSAWSPDEIRILMVHDVRPPEDHLTEPHLRTGMDVDAFVANLRALRRSYEFISMDEAVAMLEGHLEWRPGRVALTFDDSLKCHATVSAPVLAEMGIPAIFYLSTDVINTRGHYWFHRVKYALAKARTGEAEISVSKGRRIKIHARRPMSTYWEELARTLQWLPASERDAAVLSIEEQLGAAIGAQEACFGGGILTWDDARALRACSMTLGSHTVTHPNLALLSSEEIRRELTSSRERIQSECESPCDHLCYPCGCDTATARRVAKDLGFRSAVLSGPHELNTRACDRYGLSRHGLPDEPHKAPYMLSGMHDRIHRGIRDARELVAALSRRMRRLF